MIRRMSMLVALVAVLCAGTVNAQSFTYDVDVDSLDTGVVDDRTFALPAIESIKSIEIEIAQTWGGDMEITLTAPDGVQYIPMFDEVDDSGSGNFDMGLVAGDPSLANVGNYVWVASGGATSYADDYAAPGTYDANSWGAGPHAAGDWNMLINDDAAGDPTSVGSVTINYNVVPEPTTGLMLLAGLAGIGFLRRK